MSGDAVSGLLEQSKRPARHAGGRLDSNTTKTILKPSDNDGGSLTMTEATARGDPRAERGTARHSWCSGAAAGYFLPWASSCASSPGWAGWPGWPWQMSPSGNRAWREPSGTPGDSILSGTVCAQRVFDHLKDLEGRFSARTRRPAAPTPQLVERVLIKTRRSEVGLYVAFWLQLDKPFWAGLSAAIVCQPHLGASLRKGWFLMIGTVVGATMI